MTPQFAAAVDPIFRQGLDLLERIQRDEFLVPADEQHALLAGLEQGEIQAGASQEWDLARYALVSWLDELLVDTPWVGQEWWSNNVLEMQLYHTRDCHEEFYVKAGEAARFKQRNALAVYHDCVLLGFRGLYRDVSQATSFTRPHGLPTELSEWIRKTQLTIRTAEHRPKLLRAQHEVQGARPLTASAAAVWAWTTAAVVLALNVACFRLLYY